MFSVLKRSLLRFARDDCSLHASALTYYTLIAIVPLIALLLGLAKGFDLDALAERYLLEQFPQHDVVTKEAISFSRNLIEQIKSGWIAGIGVMLLIWSGVKLLSNVESSFNHIWGIERGRPWPRKIIDFIAVALLSPFLFIASNAFFSLLLRAAVALTNQLPPFTKWGLFLLPIVSTTLLIFLLLKLMPSVKVPNRSALIAAFVTAVFLHLFQTLYFNFQSFINSYGAIYGSFAAFPLFLLWLQTSWMITLFGAELSRALSDPEGEKRRNGELSSHKKRIIALTLLQEALTYFKEGKGAISLEALKEKTGISLPDVGEAVETLKEKQLLAETEMGLIPLRESQSLTLLEALKQLEMFPNGEKPEVNSCLENRFEELYEQMKKSRFNSPLIDIY